MIPKTSILRAQTAERRPVFETAGGVGAPDREPGLVWVLNSLWKHKVLLVACWLGVTALGCLGTWALPSVYQAEAVILAQSLRASEAGFGVAPLAAWQERLNVAGWQVLNSGQLTELVRHLHRPRDPAVTPAEMARSIWESAHITLGPERAPDRSATIRVTCEQADPAMAAHIANWLSQLLIQELQRERQSQIASTCQFLGGQLATARAALERCEKALTDFRQRYSGELPEQENALLAALGRLQTESASALEGIVRAERKRDLLAADLGAARLSAASPAQPAESSVPVRLPQDNGPGTSALGPKIERLKQRLNELRMHYTDDHPDVKRLRSELAQLEELGQREANGASAQGLIPRRPARASAVLQPPPAPFASRQKEGVDNLSSQLISAQVELAALQAKRRRLAAEQGALSIAIGRLPERKREYAALLRDYELANANYRSVANQRLSAETAVEMERQQQTERLRVVEEARVPSHPIRPNRWPLRVLGSLTGLVIGALISVARGMDRKTLWELLAGAGARGHAPDSLRRYTSA
jgi:uncharacterized protein involved in exopolysaccharide biosynthesis